MAGAVSVTPVTTLSMSFIRLTPLLLLLLAGVVYPACAQRQNSIRSPRLRPAVTAGDSPQLYDTVACRPGMVLFAGYDKALRASKETVFVTNLMNDTTVEALWFSVTYLDTAGRELHRLQREVRASIPPGATRRLDFPSWDVQRSFYYVGSPPRRSRAIPYTVTILPDSLLLTY